MRILQVATSLSEGGLARVLLDLSQELARRGHQVSLCTTHMPGVHFPGTEHLWHTLHQFAAPSQLYKLNRLREVLQRESFDVVNTWQEPIGLIAASWFSRAAAVDTIELLEFWKDLAPFPLPQLRQLCTTRFVACSKEMHDEMERDRLCPLPKLTYIDNAIRVPEPADTAWVRQFRAERGIPDGARVLGTVARFAVQKGLKYLLAAMPEVLAAHPDVHLLLIGDGELRPELRQQADALRLGERVHFLGWRDDVQKVVTCLDLFLLPSLFEGLSIALLEVMTQAKPIVATAIPSTARVAEGCAELVPVEDAAALARAANALLADPARAAALGQAARKRVLEQFTAGRMADEYLELYDVAVHLRKGYKKPSPSGRF